MFDKGFDAHDQSPSDSADVAFGGTARGRSSETSGIAGKGLAPKRPRPGEFRGGPDDTRLKSFLKKRAGGPSTPGGRATSSKNSLKHGAYALMPPKTDEFYNISKGVVEELNPHGVIGRTLCESVAHDLMKLKSLEAYEREQIKSVEQRHVCASVLAERVGFPWAQTHSQMLISELNTFELQRQVLKSWRTLARPTKGFSPGPETSVPDLRVAGLYDRVCERLSEPGFMPFAEEALLAQLDVVMGEAGQGLGYLGQRIEKRQDCSMLVSYWLFRNEDGVRSCIREITSERVIGVLVDERMSRAKAHAQGGLRCSLSSIQLVKDLRSTAWE